MFYESFIQWRDNWNCKADNYATPAILRNTNIIFEGREYFYLYKNDIGVLSGLPHFLLRGEAACTILDFNC